MNCVFTICSNNYLAYASTLGQSLKKVMPEMPFFLFLCDRKNEGIDYAGIADTVIPLEDVEPAFTTLAEEYNIVELNTALKPRVFEYLFAEQKVTKAIYFDPDIKLFASVNFLFHELKTVNILLTPHICSSVPFDGKTPQENHFLNFGLYNLGFAGMSNSEESLAFLKWWKRHTYERGKIDVYHGVFVDQLPINLVPIFFEEVRILKNKGLNMAPWNLHERQLSQVNGEYMVNNKERLIFYHFSSFKPGNLELPLDQYDRYQLKQLPVLREIYRCYESELQENGNEKFRHLQYAFGDLRSEFLKKEKKEKWQRKLGLKR